MESLFILAVLLVVAGAQFQDQQFQDQQFPDQQFQDQQFPDQQFQDQASVNFPSNGNQLAYVLPAGYETLVTNLQTTFSCEGRPFGYYADVDNECKVFHVCNPIMSEDGQEVSVDQFSFICGNQTIFSQESLTCDYIEEATPCQEAQNLYQIVNAEFFRIDSGDEQQFDQSGGQGKSFDHFQGQQQQENIEANWEN